MTAKLIRFTRRSYSPETELMTETTKFKISLFTLTLKDSLKTEWLQMAHLSSEATESLNLATAELWGSEGLTDWAKLKVTGNSSLTTLKDGTLIQMILRLWKIPFSYAKDLPLSTENNSLARLTKPVSQAWATLKTLTMTQELSLLKCFMLLTFLNPLMKTLHSFMRSKALCLRMKKIWWLTNAADSLNTLMKGLITLSLLWLMEMKALSQDCRKLKMTTWNPLATAYSKLLRLWLSCRTALSEMIFPFGTILLKLSTGWNISITNIAKTLTLLYPSSSHSQVWGLLNYGLILKHCCDSSTIIKEALMILHRLSLTTCKSRRMKLKKVKAACSRILSEAKRIYSLRLWEKLTLKKKAAQSHKSASKNGSETGRNHLKKPQKSLMKMEDHSLFITALMKNLLTGDLHFLNLILAVVMTWQKILGLGSLLTEKPLKLSVITSMKRILISETLSFSRARTD